MKPVLLDLYCGAGGAARGYADAGFDVIGVDIKPQPRYPFPFVQGDALDVLAGWDLLRPRFEAIHASPPCQIRSKGAGQFGTRHRHSDLIAPTRKLLQAAGVPYVIENIEEARGALVNPIMLCGTMFDLGVFRHRAFEMWPQEPLLPLRASIHPTHDGRIGDGKYVTVTGKPGGYARRDGIQHGRLADWKRAMDIDWMTARELAQAIPPAYTRFIGEQLLVHLAAGVR